MGLLGSDRLDRRGFLKRFGIAGAVGGAGIPCGTSPPWGRSPDFPRCWVLGAEDSPSRPPPAALAFGVAAGSIAQVIWQIGRGMTRPDERSREFGAAGLVIGFLVMYVTGLLT